jgi:hypothetical protein
VDKRGEAYTENHAGQRGGRTALKRVASSSRIQQTATAFVGSEANTEDSRDRVMGEILWHCRETRQQTENTNIALKLGHGENPEGLSGSWRLACMKRSDGNLGGPIGSRRSRYGMRLLRHERGNPDTELDRSLQPACRGSGTDRRGRTAGSGWGVRPAHSTPRAGEPRPWGRGRRSCAADTGHFIQTRRADP